MKPKSEFYEDENVFIERWSFPVAQERWVEPQEGLRELRERRFNMAVRKILDKQEPEKEEECGSGDS